MMKSSPSLPLTVLSSSLSLPTWNTSPAEPPSIDTAPNASTVDSVTEPEEVLASMIAIVLLSGFSISSCGLLLGVLSPSTTATALVMLSLVVPGVLRSSIRTLPVLPLVSRFTTSTPDATSEPLSSPASARMLMEAASWKSSSLSVTTRLTSS